MKATIGAVLSALVMCSCSETKLVMDGTMRLEGPIQIQTSIAGPSIQYDGVYVSDELIERVDKGKTRTDWILAVFGEPNEQRPLDDGSSIWKWSYRPSSQQVSIVSVFGGSDDKPASAPRTVYVQMKDDVVADIWHD